MIRYHDIGALPLTADGRAVAIGAFDGVHMGHQEVIRLAVDSARRRAAPSTVITFEPNPLAVLHPEFKTTSLTDAGFRGRLIERLGVDELLEIPFTHEFSQIPWDRFCRMLIDAPVAAATVAVGRNFRFGHGGEGTAKMLREFGRGEGVDVEIPGLVTSPDGKPISSTRIRRLIAQGDLAEVVPLLGRPHCISGTIVHGDGRGTGIGLPTANVAVNDRMAVPGKGVYAAKVGVGERWWSAAVNIGQAPTFRTSGECRLEAFLIDYPGDDIYGDTARIAFLARLRPEQRFSGADALMAQVHRDIDQARQIGAGAADPLC